MVCGFSLVAAKGAAVEWDEIGCGWCEVFVSVVWGGLHLKIVTETRKMIND